MKKESIKNIIITYVKKAIVGNKILYPQYGWRTENISSKLGTITVNSTVVSDNDRWQQVWEIHAYANGICVKGFYEYNEEAPDRFFF